MSSHSAQPQKKGWKHRIAQWLEPVTPQLIASAQNWNPVRNPCPEHPQASMCKVEGVWKCPLCITDAMKPVQATPERPQILVNPTRLLGMARDQRAAELVKPLPPKPAWIQTNPDLKKEACQPPPTLPPKCELPRLTADQRVAAFESISTIPTKPATPGQKPRDLTGKLGQLPYWVLAAMPVELPGTEAPGEVVPEDQWVINTNPAASGPLPVNYAEIEVWGERENKPPEQSTGALTELETLALRRNSETLEVPIVTKQKQAEKYKESEE